jgi:transitional endoplasmic reticulum ATPase
MVMLSDISGDELLVQKVRENVVDSIKNNDSDASKRVIIYGPPGTGKTYVSKAIAGELGLDIKILSPSMQVEEITNLISSISSDDLLFIDEIDKFGESNALEDTIEKVGDNILIVGATNYPWKIQPLISGGFNSLVFMPEPDLQARKAIIENFLGENAENVDVDKLAELTEDCTAADIYKLIREKGESNLEETIQNNKPTTLTDWIKELRKNKDTLDPVLFKPLLQWLETE